MSQILEPSQFLEQLPPNLKYLAELLKPLAEIPLISGLLAELNQVGEAISRGKLSIETPPKSSDREVFLDTIKGLNLSISTIPRGDLISISQLELCPTPGCNRLRMGK